MMTTWGKLPPLEAGGAHCNVCNPVPAKAPLDKLIAVGFGDAHVSRDGETVYREPSGYENMIPCPNGCDGDGKINGALCGTCGGPNQIEDPDARSLVYWEFVDAEAAAVADPDHDWRVVLNAPLHGETYQRQGVGKWLLVEKNEGFA